MREALLEAAGGPAAQPADVVAAAKAVLIGDEVRVAEEAAKDAVRAEVAADASWLQWSELCRKLVPLVVSKLGDLGEGLVVEAARQSAP